MIYEILVGRRPAGRFKMPTELNPRIPAKFDDIISRCLAQEQKDRYQRAVELKDDILEVMVGRAEKKVAAQNGDVKANSFIGKCDFLDTLKETKYSTTMLVENRETHELYVIKKNNRNNTGLKEARMLTGLKHKNIVKVYGAGGDHNRLIVMMEYTPGGSLEDRMVRPYEFAKAMEIISSVADALEFAHRNGIVHGNLRPSNILFTSDETVKVTDFGLPPHYNLMQKNHYAPPEKRVSIQGDIYSLGVILHRMLFHRNPAYDRNSYLFLGELSRQVPGGMLVIFEKLLAIRAAKRYQSIEEFLVDWETLQKEIDDSKKRTSRKKVVKPIEKSPKGIIAAIIISSAVISIFVYLHVSGIFKLF
jgi:serine/threonine-protein kinase